MLINIRWLKNFVVSTSCFCISMHMHTSTLVCPVMLRDLPN